MSAPLLIELLTEELPPKALSALASAFAEGVRAGLVKMGLATEEACVQSFATPRRLAVLIDEVLSNAQDVSRRDKVLPVSVGRLAEGGASPSLIKKLSAMGFADRTIEDLEVVHDGKQEVFYISYIQQGAVLAEVLQSVLNDAAAALPIPKVMTYQIHAGTTAQQDVQFVRPVKRLLVLFGDQVLPVSAFGVSADRFTDGHRFMSKRSIEVPDALSYVSVLRDLGSVEPDFGVRRERINEQLMAQAGDLKVVMPPALLDEVTALTEWPVVYKAQFDRAFLAVPQECLVLTMQTNQKYFALTDSDGSLVNEFLVVSNILTSTPQEIIEGNARVVRPRLADAQFFFEQDKKRSLDEMVQKLQTVVYHNKLGSQGERVARVQGIAQFVAQQLGVNEVHAMRAAYIAKADLVSDMVGEFPELQGVMGRYYAIHHGEHPDVAAACEEHYQPRFSGDDLPASQVGMVAALADKLETLVGIWGVGLQPTGERDPFALRRHALGVVRMLLEKHVQISLKLLLTQVQSQFNQNNQVKYCVDEVHGFMLDRLRGLLKEQGYMANQIEAVLVQNVDDLSVVSEKLAAVQAFAQLPEALDLAAANKRCVNILRKAQDKGESLAECIDESVLTEPAERALVQAMGFVAPLVYASMAENQYATALSALAKLREPVDAFFADVMVMDERAQVRANRLKLLADLAQLMNGVADISQLAV